MCKRRKSRHCNSTVQRMNDQESENLWPPDCCVAAFVASALNHLGYLNINHADLAQRLQTRVRPNSKNPWGLMVEYNPDLQGVLVADAKKYLPSILCGYSSQLCFRHVPFNTVLYRDFHGVLEQAINRGGVVGVGFDYAMLMGQTETIRHVARLVPTNDQNEVMLIDNSVGEPPSEQVVKWIDLESAVFAISDGFWIIGPERSMHLDYALRWNSVP